MKFTEEQQQILNRVFNGENVFITGGAGVGKSFLIEYISKNKNKFAGQVGITSTTGTSSLLINGTTLHSFLGIGLGTNTVGAIHTAITAKKYIRKRWIEMSTLVIDEISMLTAQLFDKIEELARRFRRNDKPFGGIQLILSGDFCQLPPIGVSSGSEKFCFDASTWYKCMPDSNVEYLTKIIRQNDEIFQKALNNIRMGIIDQETKDIFNICIGASDDTNDIKQTKLFPLNYCVDNINDGELSKAVSENNLQLYEYERECELYSPSECGGSKKEQEIVVGKYKKYCIIPETLQLCLGCQVMLIHNLDLHDTGKKKLVNGSRGVIIDFIEDIPKVKFTNGRICLIDYHIWEIEENDIKYGKIIQIPLRLGYAFSIHKSQGCSLDKVTIDLKNVFDYGMAYVALSRVRDLKGLNIIGIDWDKIKVHPQVVGYYNKINSRIMPDDTSVE